MDHEQFEKQFSELASLLRTGVFCKIRLGGNLEQIQEQISDVDYGFETDLYDRFLDYEFELKIITSRLESEIEEFIPIEKNFFQQIAIGNQPSVADGDVLIYTLAKISLDVSDFFVYTRVFLDTLYMCIRYSFKVSGNSKWKLMKNSAKELLNEEKMQVLKKEIDAGFFEGLEQRTSWIHSLRGTRNGLLHRLNHFTYMETIQAKHGYDLKGKIGGTWGIEKIRPILGQLQVYVDKLADMMEYLNKNLPRV